MPIEYSRSAIAAMKIARRFAKQKGHGYIGSEHLLMGLVKEPEGTAGALLREFQVTEKKLLELIDKLIAPSGAVNVADKNEFTPRADAILKAASSMVAPTQLVQVGTEHILLAIVTDTECVASRLLHTMEVNGANVQKRLLEIIGVDESHMKDILQAAEPGEDISNLEQFGRDLTQQAKDGELENIVGRDKETDRILQILSRKTKNNPCLIGEPGVGKTAIVEGLAERIAAGQVPESLRGKRVLSLDMASLVAGTKYRGEFEERMKKVLNEVMANDNILLFIDEIHTIIGAGGAEGALDASNIMKPFLSRGEIQVIGATTVDEYRKHIEKDPALERRFQPVMVEQPTQEETVAILEGLRESYEKHHGVSISEEALAASVTLSERYVNDRFLPDKAIDLMDESCARRQLQGAKFSKKVKQFQEMKAELETKLEAALQTGDFDRAKWINHSLEEVTADLAKEEKKAGRSRSKIVVTEEDIAETVSTWTGVPVSRISGSEGKHLLKLEKQLHERVIGQDDAVTAIAKAIRRGRAGLKDPRRPIGSFLFLGPTGVGKTELSKAVAEAVFGSEQSMIRVDMSEYMEKHSVSKLVGSPPGYVGYDEGGQLSEKVRRHPYSVILFDEIEKAHPDVFNILLQVLDEGHITDSQGRKVDFKNTILIMTSNAGASNIVEPKHLGFGAGNDEQENYNRMKGNVMEEVRHLFKPEFLNRIDATIVFHSLTKEEVASIVTLLFKDLQKRAKEQMDITIRVRPEVRDEIAKAGFDQKYGARPLRREIQNRVEDALAEEILSGKVKAGDTVTIALKDGAITFAVK